jgi:hypothetical protein
VGQLKVVYQATSEFMAVAVRDELAAHNIFSVQLLNEIPMHQGFTFGALPWAEILVSEEDLPQAREVVSELELTMNGDSTSQPYPPNLKLNTTKWPGVVWVSLLVLNTVLQVITIAWILLIILNWRMLSRHVLAALGGLLALPVILAWLIINAIPWFIRTVVSFGKFKDSDEMET